MKKAAVIYLSLTGNTEKVAESIQQGLVEGGVQTSLLKAEDAGEVNFYDFDLICLGTPSHRAAEQRRSGAAQKLRG